MRWEVPQCGVRFLGGADGFWLSPEIPNRLFERAAHGRVVFHDQRPHGVTPCRVSPRLERDSVRLHANMSEALQGSRRAVASDSKVSCLMGARGDSPLR